MPLPRNIVVRASAGTGKTYKLVETWVRLVEEGDDPLRIIAMTFTEKAAADMRARIREAILERMKAMSPADHAKWTRTLTLLPAAPISTIHGFCGMLLRDHGLHAGLDPSFAILDEQRSYDLAREAAVDTIRNRIREGDEQVAALFAGFGLAGLVEGIVSTSYWINSLGKDAVWLSDKAREQLQAAEELSPAVASYLERFDGDFERLGLFADDQDVHRPRHPLKKRDDPDAPLPRIGQIAGAAVAVEMARLIDFSRQSYADRKRAANALNFDDLLIETRNLLRDFPGVRESCQKRFETVLVDEFQDTDEVQAEIVRLLTQDPLNPGHYAQGKLMIVGDAKQSIYRFRRARVTVFVRMTNELQQDGGEVQHLQENRRAAPPLAEFSNRLSEFVMDGQGRVNPPQDVDLSYRIRFTPADALVPRSERSCLGLTYIAADPSVKAAVGRPMEAKAVARLLQAWRASGTIQSWSEVAVLMRTMTNAGTYIEELEAHGIPVHVVEGTAFYQKSEVSDLIALLEMVLNPSDPLVRAIVLTSPMAGLSFTDLLAGRTSEEFEQIIQPWIDKRDRATAAEVLEDVVRKTNFDVVVMAQKNGRQRVANIGKLIEITRNLGRQGTTALDDVVRYLRARAQDTSVRESEAQTTSQDDDVVSLLTVHRAKGLEFDVVVVPDLAAQTQRSSSSNSFVQSDHWGLLVGAVYGLHRKPLPHSLMLRAKEEEKDQQFEEEKRLLYVAITRARKMLVLGEGFAGRNTGPWQRWVSNFLETVQPEALDRARSGKTTRVRLRSGGQDFSIEILSAAAFTRPEQLPLNIDIAAVNRQASYAQFQELADTIAARSERQPISLEMTPSELSLLDGCARYFEWTRLQGLVEPGLGTGSPDAARLGSLVHQILESGEQPTMQSLKEQGIPDLEAVFQTEEFRKLSGEDHERELAFIMKVDAGGKECFVRGRMDAVVPGDPPRVVDYKYAAWREGAEARYELQMLAYSLALMKSTNVDRAVGELWYLKRPMKVVRKEYTRAEAEQRIAGVFEDYFEALSSGTWRMAERSYCDAVACGFRERCWNS